MLMIRAMLTTVLAIAGATASATTAYKCTGANGAVVYQDKPCAETQRQQAIHLSDEQPQGDASPAPIAPDPAPEDAPAPPAPAAPMAPLPVMYACQRATDGKTYLSSNGDPAPYQAPFGVLGAVQAPLSEAYGSGGGSASAPELNRGKVTSGMVANDYVWVQDQCRELGIQETCEALQDEYDENEHKLKQAFQSERAPFEKREAELQAQLANCGD